MASKEETPKKDLKEVQKKPMTKEELQEALIHNFIKLQKALTNIAVKFDELSTNISKLLQLFEISAKSFAEKYSSIENDEKKGDIDKEFIKKLDTLLEQNKIISKGIMLIEERIRERNNNIEKPSAMQPQNITNQNIRDLRFAPKY
ncbi:MAG: hypothetical protein QXW97_02735 [Candidatus Pacearchaeota archaeon]